MKNVLFAIIISVFGFVQSVSAVAAKPAPVEMVSYEQGWTDSYGTIALKNNTSGNLHNVTFTLEYLDMNGRQLDYETFTRDIEIAPGKTKKLDIPAYEHARYYHYYKTKDDFGNPAFKLRFELNDYKIREPKVSGSDCGSGYEGTASETTAGENKENDGIAAIVLLVILMICLGVFIGMYVLVGVMAKKRHRSVFLWVTLSFFMTPLTVCIILLAIGRKPTDEYYY